ncbi:hypothetical protein LX81_01395 [Palleronia aestuarii]|uniref:Uncharacterized protein n=1 Tax=Palleronia aestuarii TaxID=568105 RepID=A0A2W7NCG8_9RHOB|nr:hypothetical protein [Palleronia aestuarii]PZX17670.1 hypothetical protein LX81_01395 [Palleronia aestuarii]
MSRALMSGIALVAVAACGGAEVDERVARPTSNRVSVETYLATPEPNDITLDRAQKRCLTRGTTAVYLATVKLRSGRFQHVYECYEGLPIR